MGFVLVLKMNSLASEFSPHTLVSLKISDRNYKVNSQGFRKQGFGSEALQGCCLSSQGLLGDGGWEGL